MNDCKICCFTGHRTINRGHAINALRTTLPTLVSEGYTVFRAGGAMGFDMAAALCVLELKQRCDVRLELFLPCRNQADRWTAREKNFYRYILQKADSVCYVNEQYTPSCMHERNRRMVDGSDLCIAYLRHSEGGTYYTVSYAKKKGVPVLNLAKK